MNHLHTADKNKTLVFNNIEYKINFPLNVDEVINVFKSSGINRPVHEPERIFKMIQYANLIISAWNKDKLVGIARSVTDFSYCCYLSDLAVKKEYQHKGIGKKLIELTRQEVSNKSMLLLLSAPPAMEYYPKQGFEKVENGFIIKRN